MYFIIDEKRVLTFFVFCLKVQNNYIIENLCALNVKAVHVHKDKKLCTCRQTARRVFSLVTTKVTFKLTQGHWQSCHLIGHT